MLTSVVVAVLLENFSAASAAQDMEAQHNHDDPGTPENRLDPLLKELSTSTNSQELSRRIGLLFAWLDQDDRGRISWRELCALRKLDLRPRIVITSDDADRFISQRFRL